MLPNVSASNRIRTVLIEADEHDFEISRQQLLYEADSDDYEFEVKWADSLMSAVEYLESHHVEAVLLDVALPDSVGLDTFIKINTVVAGTPIIILTSLEYERVGGEAVRRGAQDCLIKGEVDGRTLASSILYSIERKEIENSLKLQYATTCILAQSGSVMQSVQAILSEICTLLRWDCASVFCKDPDGLRVTCGHFWNAPQSPLPEFKTLSQKASFVIGKGFAERTWDRDSSVLITDVLQNSEFPRWEAAVNSGIRGAVALPIISNGERLGVMEFFSQEELPCHRHTIKLLSLLGTQVGQSIRHKAAEENLRYQKMILHSVLDSVAEGVVVADHLGKGLFFNPAGQKMVGLGLLESEPSQWAELYGTYKSDMVTLYRYDELPLYRALSGEAVDGEEMFIRNEERPKGVWININARPLISDTGQLLGGVIVFRDITAHKRLAEFQHRLGEIAESNDTNQLIDQIKDCALLLVNASAD